MIKMFEIIEILQIVLLIQFVILTGCIFLIWLLFSTHLKKVRAEMEILKLELEKLKYGNEITKI